MKFNVVNVMKTYIKLISCTAMKCVYGDDNVSNDNIDNINYTSHVHHADDIILYILYIAINVCSDVNTLY